MAAGTPSGLAACHSDASRFMASHVCRSAGTVQSPSTHHPEEDQMSVIPKCPHCGSTEQPKAIEQDHDATTVLVLYCSSCGSILGAADSRPHYPRLGGPDSSAA
jgi:hypothetical protein